MPIIGNVGRRFLKVRFMDVVVHGLLAVGALTIIYPFLVMLSGSMKSNIDSRTLDVVPEYFYKDEVHYRKWLEARYNEAIAEYNNCHRQKTTSFMATGLPERPVERRAMDYEDFLRARKRELTKSNYFVGNLFGNGVKPELLRKFVAEVKAEPDVQGDLIAFNRKYNMTFTDWNTVIMPVTNPLPSGSTGETDAFQARAYKFFENQPLAGKYYYSADAYFVEQTIKPRYGQTLHAVNAALKMHFRSWEEITLSRTVPPEGDPLRDAWIFFVKRRLNADFIRVLPEALPQFHAHLQKQYAAIAEYNKNHIAKYASFEEIPLPDAPPRGGLEAADWMAFIVQTASPEFLVLRTTDFLYRDYLAAKYGDIVRLDQSHSFSCASRSQIRASARLPEHNLALAADWTEFVAQKADLAWLAPDSAANVPYRAFIAAPYKADLFALLGAKLGLPHETEEQRTAIIAAVNAKLRTDLRSAAEMLKDLRLLNREFGFNLSALRADTIDMTALNQALGTTFAEIEDVLVTPTQPANPKLAERWTEFMRSACPRGLIVLNAPAAEQAWQIFLVAKYPTVAALNASYGLTPANFDRVKLPTEDRDFFLYQADRRHSMREFITRNYAMVFDMMFRNGGAIVNTLIYCFMAIAGALIVNPMAAYALSRYKPPSQYKFLLFLMLTMAFPEMVLGIPTFLLIRNLGLLNTFWALVLPGIANGYSIFLLKGFFDAQPKELYESAQLDGASEWTMFWRITMSTSKPILAVIALAAFRSAYSNFMMAFLLCQDPKRWTVMVHIYQLQMDSAQGVVFASLIIAALPTLVVFLFAQNLIIRGIVVPVEK